MRNYDIYLILSIIGLCVALAVIVRLYRLRRLDVTDAWIANLAANLAMQLPAAILNEDEARVWLAEQIAKFARERGLESVLLVVDVDYLIDRLLDFIAAESAASSITATDINVSRASSSVWPLLLSGRPAIQR